MSGILANPMSAPAAEVSFSSTGVVSSVPYAAASQQILAANNNRRGGSVANNSTNNVYVAFEPEASASNFTVIVEPKGFFSIEPTYRGIVSAFWAEESDGELAVTELLTE